jgi:hypothetical protein
MIGGSRLKEIDWTWPISTYGQVAKGSTMLSERALAET